MGDTCKTCKHWQEDENQDYWRSGECDHPQRQTTFEGLRVRPLTLAHHTCDKHEQQQTDIDKPDD